jgi:hypothetical protein
VAPEQFRNRVESWKGDRMSSVNLCIHGVRCEICCRIWRSEVAEEPPSPRSLAMSSIQTSGNRSPRSGPPTPPRLVPRLLCVGLLLVGGCGSPPEVADVPDPVLPRPVEGVLRISAHGGEGTPAGLSTSSSTALTHTAVWVNGPHYRGHSDNDIRGFLDGHAKFAWNQSTQIHVRVGRLGGTPAPYVGERELFRNLHRWEGVRIPDGATLTAASLELDVEIAHAGELDLFLYQLHKDFFPGEGGVDRNNNSAPNPGEVWWGERARGQDLWGLPGAGFASETHPDADTPVEALARARYVPGTSTVSFESRALADYIEEQVVAGEPLRFLLKLSDTLEDVEGPVLGLYSAEYGDSRNTAHRPRLRLEWLDPSERWQLERPILLEHGRSMVLPRIESPGMSGLSVGFLPADGAASPRVLVRGGRGEAVSEWIEAALPISMDWDWVEVRLEALVNPTPIGQAFQAGLRDTWVTSGAPEDQEVFWTFVSPSGARHDVLAKYSGDYSWEVEFVPDEIGQWAYQWRQQFIGQPFESPVGVFDVFVADYESALEALQRLTARIEASGLESERARIDAYGSAFNRLQRAILAFETPESFPLNGDSGDRTRAAELLDAAREVMSMEPIPEPRIHVTGG